MNHAVKFRAARLTLVAVATLSGDAIATQVHWPVQTRNVQFENLSTENGLSSEFVHDLVQGPRGYIWVATQAGLNRFDGQDVALYEHHPDDRTSLSHNFVWTVHADAENRLWVGTDRGVDLYDPVADAFIRRPFGGAVAGLRIRRIVQDRAGRFWIGSLGSGLVAVRPGGGQMTHYRHHPGEPGSLPSDNIIDVLEDRNGELWVGTDGGGLARLDQTTDTFTVFRHDPSDPASLSDDHVRSVYEDAQGRLWIGTAQGGLNRFDPAVSGFVQYGHVPGDPDSLGRGQVKSLFEDTRGTLWIGTENGVSEWRPSTDSFATYVRDLSDRKSLIDDRVNTISQDASGVLWIGTSGGVSAWNYLSDTFHQYRRANGFLQSDVVTSIDQTSDGFFWVATYGGGLTQLDLDGSIARHHRHLANDPASLNDDRVMAVHVDPTDTVWVGTRSGGLGRLNDDGTFTRFQFDPDNPDTLSGNAVTRILSSQDGGLWIGVFGGGLNRLTWRDGTPVFERFRHDPADDTTLSSDRVLALHEDRHGVIWIGTENAGLNRFDPAERRFRRFDIEQSDAADAPDPVNGTPWDLAETNDGTMWIGTLGQGLLRWSSADRAAGRTRFDAFGPEVGLPFDVYAVVQGDDGALWLSSNRGLFRFDVRDASVRKFDRSNGLRNHEFNQGARLLSHSGRVMFGGTGGLLEFLPADIPHNAHPPRIELEARSRTDLLARSAGNGVAAVELGYLDPFVTFRFVALDFVSPDKNEYRFRLAGYDGDWTDAEGYRRAIYSSLPAGNYTFEVQASNSDGVWNREGPTMQVRVIPAPWRSRWAYLTYALLAIGAVVAVLRW